MLIQADSEIINLCHLFTAFCLRLFLGFRAVFLGRLVRVYLMKPASMSVRPSVRPYVRTSVRPQKVSSIRMKFVMEVEVNE